ncbi:MAG: hypothetical protein ACYDDV_12040 [Methanoregula sp.]
MYQPTFNEISQKVYFAIDSLFKNDNFLLTIGVHERTISHKLAEYLQAQFPDWNVDCEYNRKGNMVKRLPRDCSEEEKVYPDIIIHHRNTTENLLVIEIKSSNLPEKCDIEKLKLFTSDPNFKYTYGLFIRFKKTDKPILIWFEGGEDRSNNCTLSELSCKNA